MMKGGPVAIQVITSTPWPTERQIPPSINAVAISDGCTAARANVVLVLEDVPSELDVHIDDGILIFSTGEPSSISRRYHKKFLDQFDLIISNRELNTCRKVIISRPLLPWFAGMVFDPELKKWKPGYRYSFQQLQQSSPRARLDKLCVITSNKRITAGHRKRVHLIEQLARDHPELIDIYGVGFNAIADKYETLSKYKYALVIENAIEDNYWTEKIADAILAECAIFYVGCPNISDYLPIATVKPISFNSLEQTIETLTQCLSSNWYDSVLGEIGVAKKILMENYNIYSELLDVWRKEKKNGNISTSTRRIKPQRHWGGFIWKLTGKARRLIC